ncbi:MAG: T9SS type A sorting domain-containing protein [Bacteroidales bacterium]|nr:T9SS type A sorting domain-containing protein [Bacteroidales bacterium]
MNNFTFSRHLFTMFLATMALFSSVPVLAQYVDDPNRDQIPQYLRDFAPTNTDAPLSTVMTVNNFDNFNLGVDFGESNIAANPMIPAWFFTAYNTNTVHHTENGIDWANGTPSFGATMQGDPVVAYDSIGNLFYQNMYGSSILGVKVMKSTNNGVTWGPSVTAVAGVDKNWMACDQTSGPYANNVYVCMTASSGGNFARSIDNGASFTTTFNASTQSLPGMMVCVGPNGNVQGKAVYVVTNSGSSFSSTYTFYRSLDGGLTFTQMSAQQFANTVGTQVSGRNSVQNMRTRPYPMIAADNSYGASRGRLYCVYASNDPTGNGNKPDIWNRYSDDGGATWSSAILVNDDPNPQTHHQWHPGIWCDKQTGRLYAMWMDTRDCPTNDSALIYASYSDNGGVTWAQNQAVSNQKMKIDCATCGGGGTPRYEGDYNGIVSNKKVGMAGWTDFRQGSFMSVTGYFPDFAMSRSPATGTLFVASDSIDFTVSVPAVKLYTDTVALSGQITPAPATGSITFSYPQGNKITTFPGSKIVRVKLSGNVPLANYQVVFFAKGPNGTPAHQRNATITVQASLALSVSVSATPSSVCAGSVTQLQAFAAGGTNPYTYTWTSNPPGFSSTLPNPNASPAAATWYICKVNDNVAKFAKDSVYVTISAVPAAPGAITGNTAPCSGTNANYSVASVPGATSYNWTIPAGASILSGQTTTSITVLWGTTSGNVSVTAGNNCGSSSASQTAVTLTPSPSMPGTIIGPSTVCTGTTVSFNVPPVAGVTNTWTVPPDATITTGQGTNAITVLWGSSAGFVSVVAQIGACTSLPVSMGVNPETIPGAALAISGSDTVCQGMGGYQYSIPLISNASSYTWSLPTGAIISSGQGTNAIQVDFGGSAISGDITAAGNNMCGTGVESSTQLTVMVCTGFNENNLLSQIRIYPNPVHGLLNISIEGKEKQLRAQVTDVSGRIMYNGLFDNLPAVCTRQIDVSGFAKGVYLIKFSNDSRIFTGKFTVDGGK